MNNIFKYLLSIVLIIGLMGCQNESEEMPEQAQQQPQQSQQQSPNQLGQMQQSAPDIELSDEEADQFTEAAMSAQSVQMEAQKEMADIIKEEGLDVQTYQKIAQSTQQTGTTAEDIDVSESEMEKFESASKALQETQAEVQKNLIAAVENEGMEIQRFQRINQALQQDPELQKQIQQKMQEKQGAAPQMQPPSNN